MENTTIKYKVASTGISNTQRMISTVCVKCINRPLKWCFNVDINTYLLSEVIVYSNTHWFIYLSLWLCLRHHKQTIITVL